MLIIETFLTLFPWIVISSVFWIVVFVFAYLLRKKKGAAYIFFPLIALFKTKRLNNLIRRIAAKKPKVWRVFWTIGIFVSFSFTIYAFYFFFVNLFNLIIDPRIENAIAPLIPGVTIDLPLFAYLILPLLFIITTHEFAHGISACNDDVDIKSTGVLGAGLFLLIGFGAFVEVNERELNSSKFHRNTRLRIAAAGTYVNAITVGIALILIVSFPLLVSPFYGAIPQVGLVLTPEEGGFNYGNLSNDDAIVAIKKSFQDDDKYIYLYDVQGTNPLHQVLYNETGIIECAVGDQLSVKTYNPTTNQESVKTITLGPRYDLGIEYEYIDNYTLKITKVFPESEGGINYDKGLSEGLLIKEVNSTKIDLSNEIRLEGFLSNFDLKNLNITDENGNTYILDVKVEGVVIGVLTYSVLYWMYKNDVGKLFTNNWPLFLIRELSWLFIIAFSITLFNMLPLPVFDGDRIMKEIINSIFGEDYSEKKQKTDRMLISEESNNFEFTQLRVDEINQVKMVIYDENDSDKTSEIIVAEEKYNLIDSIGDGYNDTLNLNFDSKNLSNNKAHLDVTYTYWSDRNSKKKRNILNTIRLVTLFIVAGNFILSFLAFGFNLFWLY